jgi:hypothetical protein
MNVPSDVRKSKAIACLAIGALLAMLVLASVGAPQTVRAGGSGAGRSNLAAVASPTPLPHLLWQYDVVVALNPAHCAGQQEGLGFHGNGDVLISGGGALSYGCLRHDGISDVIIEPPYKPRAGDIRNGGSFDPPAEWVRNLIQLQVDFTDQAQAACDLLPIYKAVRTEQSTEAVIPPGNYSSIIVTDTLTMLPGLYCLTGDLMIYSGATLVGEGVTIYMTGGNFTVSGGAEVHLAAPAEGILFDPLWRDLLLYVANDYAATINLAGNTLSNYHGVVYAPASDISVSYAGSYHTQLIGWNVQIGSTSDIILSVDFWPEMPSPDLR